MKRTDFVEEIIVKVRRVYTTGTLETQMMIQPKLLDHDFTARRVVVDGIKTLRAQCAQKHRETFT